MKIGYIINPTCVVSGLGNGVLKQALTWAEGLRSLGHEVHFVGPRGDGSIRALKEFDVVHFFQHGQWLNGFLNTKREKQRWFFSPILDSTASIRSYGLLAKLPIDHYLFSFGPRLLRKFSMKAVVLVRSEYEQRYLNAVAPSAIIKKIPIAIPLTKGEMRAPKEPLPADFVLFVGGMFAERKNVLRLIEACERIGQPLVLVGNQRETSYMTRINKAINQSEIPVVKFDFLPDEELRFLYQKCRVFCLPSLIEGVGQVAMEAMYSGAPVVVTKVGGPIDYFGDFATYVDPLNNVNISNGISLHLKSERKSQEEIKKWVERFSCSEIAKQLIKVYETV